jgi:hypothetical protein
MRVMHAGSNAAQASSASCHCRYVRHRSLLCSAPPCLLLPACMLLFRTTLEGHALRLVRRAPRRPLVLRPTVRRALAARAHQQAAAARRPRAHGAAGKAAHRAARAQRVTRVARAVALHVCLRRLHQERCAAGHNCAKRLRRQLPPAHVASGASSARLHATHAGGCLACYTAGGAAPRTAAHLSGEWPPHF